MEEWASLSAITATYHTARGAGRLNWLQGLNILMCCNLCQAALVVTALISRSCKGHGIVTSRGTSEFSPQWTVRLSARMRRGLGAVTRWVVIYYLVLTYSEVVMVTAVTSSSTYCFPQRHDDWICQQQWRLSNNWNRQTAVIIPERKRRLWIHSLELHQIVTWEHNSP